MRKIQELSIERKSARESALPACGLQQVQAPSMHRTASGKCLSQVFCLRLCDVSKHLSKTTRDFGRAKRCPRTEMLELLGNVTSSSENGCTATNDGDARMNQATLSQDLATAHSTAAVLCPGQRLNLERH